MNVWLSLPFLAPDGLRELTLVAEETGIAGVALSDHVCVPAKFDSPYPYAAGKPTPLPLDTQLPDPLVAIASLAAVTRRVRFMTAVLIVPLRHPLALAKAVATTAAVSCDRLDLGVGVGWLREEFEALGLGTFDERGSVMDEMLPLLPASFWSGEPTEHRGRHFSFATVAVNPVPRMPMPLFVGGHSDAALRRCAEFGDGWIGVNPSIEELRDILDRLAGARALAGTADRAFEIRTGIRGAVTPERVQALRAMGVESLVIAPWQIGDRRESVFDISVSAISDALPDLVASVLAA